MKNVFVTISLFLSLSATAQNSAKAYLSPEDFRNGKSTSIGSVAVTQFILTADSTESIFSIESPDARTGRKLKKSYWAIERNDTVYLNCCKLFHKAQKKIGRPTRFKAGTYARVLFQTSHCLHFRTVRTNIPGTPVQPTGHTEALPLPIAAIAIIAEGMEGTEPIEMFHYLYDFDVSRVVYFSRGAMMSYAQRASPEKDSAFIEYVDRLIKSER